MKTFSKLIVASALVVSFAAPVLADVQFEGLTLAERNVYTNPQTAGWTKAYAMQAPMKAHWIHSGRDFTASIQ